MRRLLTFAALAVVAMVASLLVSENVAASDRSKDALIASNLKAKEALDLLNRGLRDEAIVAALQGLPERFTEQDVERFNAAYQALYRSFRSWSVQLPLPKEDFYHASFSPDGSRVVTRSLYGLIARPNGGAGLQLWDRRKRSLIAGLLSAEESAAPGMGVQPSSFSADDKYFANLNTRAVRIVVWRSEDGKIHRELALPQGSKFVQTQQVHLSATGRYAATIWPPAGQPRVLVFDVVNGKLLWSRNCGILPVIAISDNEQLIGCLGRRSIEGPGELVVYDIERGEPVWSADQVSGDWLDLGADGQTVILGGSGSDRFMILDRASNKRTIVEGSPNSTPARLSPDKRHIVQHLQAGEMRLFDAVTGNRVQLPLGQQPFLDSVFAENGAQISYTVQQWAHALWRKAPTGAALYDAVWRELSEADRKKVAGGRIQFRSGPRPSLASENSPGGGVPSGALNASNLKAKEALELLGRGLRDDAVVTALQGLPKSFTKQDIQRFGAAYQALYRAFRSWNVQLPFKAKGLYFASFSPDGRRVVTSLAGGLRRREKAGPGLELWDRRKRSLIAEVLSSEASAAVGGGVLPTSFSADGRYFANLSTKELRVVVWRSEDGKVHRKLPTFPNLYARAPIISPHSILLSPTGKYLATTWEAVWKADGPQETILLVFDVEGSKLLWSRNCGRVPTIDVSDDERLVGCLGGYDPVKRVAGTLSVFNLASGEPTWSGKLLGDWFDLSPDGQKAVADGFIFDSASIIDRHASGPVTAKRPRSGDASRFSPDGKYVAINLLDPRNDPTIIESATGKRVELPLEELPLPDHVFGETSGIETFMNQKQWARSLWRKSPAGTALYDAAWQELSEAERKRVEDGRVRFQ